MYKIAIDNWLSEPIEADSKESALAKVLSRDDTPERDRNSKVEVFEMEKV